MSTTNKLTGILLESALCKPGTSLCLLRGPDHLPPSQQRGLSQRYTCKTQRCCWWGLWEWSSLLLLKCTEHYRSPFGPAEVPVSTIPLASSSSMDSLPSSMDSLPSSWAVWTEKSQPICWDKLSPVQIRERLNKSSKSWDQTNMQPEFAFPSAAAYPGSEGNLHCGAPWASWPPTCSGHSDTFLGTCWLWTSRSLWPAYWQTQTLQWWHTDLRSDREIDWDPHSSSSHLWPWGSSLKLWKGGWDAALCPSMFSRSGDSQCVFSQKMS